MLLIKYVYLDDEKILIRWTYLSN